MKPVTNNIWMRKSLMAAVVCAVALAGVTAVNAAPLPVAPSGWVDEDGHSPFVRVVKHVKDAVVNISAEKEVEQPRYHNFDPFFEDWFGPRGGERSKQKSLGSGFVFRKDGYILTNHHVVNGADNITVRFSDKMELDADVVGSDQATDLAVLRVHADHDLPSIEFGDSDSLLVGDWVVAVGNPFPNQGLDRTVTVGVISGMGRKDLYFGDETPTYQDYIQTDASINPGNSGGPLVSLGGEAIGINAAIASPTGSNVGIGFAIPINFAKVVISDLLNDGRVSRGWLGIQPRDITWDDVEAEGLESANGVIVNRVIEDTPAERAGLNVGDVIIALDRVPIKDAQHFMQLIWQARAGASIQLEINRRGTPLTMDVELADRNEYLASAQTSTPTQAPEAERWLGMEVASATPERAERYGARFKPGVIVTEIAASSPAYEKGIRIGMTIAEIDHTEIQDRADYMTVVNRLRDSSRPVSLLVYDRDGNTGYFAVRPER